MKSKRMKFQHARAGAFSPLNGVLRAAGCPIAGRLSTCEQVWPLATLDPWPHPCAQETLPPAPCLAKPGYGESHEGMAQATPPLCLVLPQQPTRNIQVKEGFVDNFIKKGREKRTEHSEGKTLIAFQQIKVLL